MAFRRNKMYKLLISLHSNYQYRIVIKDHNKRLYNTSTNHHNKHSNQEIHNKTKQVKCQHKFL